MEKRFFNIQDIETRSDSDDNLHLRGRFVVYNSDYEVWEGATESIAPGAFRNSINNDVRALYNHNDDIVLGRTSAGTFSLEDRADGLWGDILLNRKDSDAMNAYERVARGDITGCSFGFNIKSEEETRNADGTIHWTITEVDPLFECSICTFPAYQATHVEARHRDLETANRRRLELRKAQLLKKLKGETENGNQSTDASQED